MAKGIKTGGRNQGTPNRMTASIRKTMTNIMQDEIANIPAYLAAVEDPAVKLELIIKLLPYVAPKIAPMDINDPYQLEMENRTSGAPYE